MLYSSGQGSGGHLSGYGGLIYHSGSGSGMSGSEFSTSGEGSVTFLTGDFMTELSRDTTPSMELGQGSVEYSGEGSGSGGFFSGSGDNRLFTASGTSSGVSSADLPLVVLPSSSSEWALTETTAGPEEALSGTELSQTSGDIDETYGSAPAPAGLAAPPTAATPASLQATGTAAEMDSVEGKSTFCF